MSWLKKLFGKGEAAPQPGKPEPQKAGAAPAAAPAAPATAAAPKAATPAAPAAPAAPAPRAFAGETISLSLMSIVNGLPDELKACVATIPDKSVEFKVPLSIIQEGLPKGAVKVTFAELKQGAPAGTFTGATDHDTKFVSLPLKEIFPKLKPDQLKVRQQKTVEVPDDIAPVFGQPARAPARPAPTPAPAAAPAAPAAAPAPAPKPAAPAPASAPAPAPKPAAPAPAPAQPAAPMPPGEIVKQAASLPGVAGALLSMLDGLSVARQLPAGLNGDALAAFIPDIFNRVSNYSKELNLGGVSSITVQLGQQTLHVCKAGRLFLTTLSQAGQPLPVDRLSSLANQLAQQNK